MSDVIELELTDVEAEKLSLQAKEVGDQSKKAAQKAYKFAELMTEMVNAVNAGNDAQNEYLRLLKRIAKARGRNPDDIVDLDLHNKSIVFKKIARDKKTEVDDDGAEETEQEPDEKPDGEDGNEENA